VVKAWLAFLQKHQYYGVGMKANIWEYESLEAATRSGYDIEADNHSRRREGPMMEKVHEILSSPAYKEGMIGHKMPEEIDLRPGAYKKRETAAERRRNKNKGLGEPMLGA
jgi:small subunit ribosomal protein S10